MSQAVTRERQLNIRLNIEEAAALDFLADHYGIGGADVLRMLLRRDEKALRIAELKSVTPPTFRGLARDLTVAGQHLTAGNIAARMGLPLGRVLAALDVMARMGLVDRVDGTGVNSTWEALATKPGQGRIQPEHLASDLEARGIDLDETIEEFPDEEQRRMVRRAAKLLERAKR